MPLGNGGGGGGGVVSGWGHNGDGGIVMGATSGMGRSAEAFRGEGG